MSEFSESLHFRRPQSLSDESLRDALRASTLAGALLPSSTRWTTFVPFTPFDVGTLDEGSEPAAGARLSIAVGAPVLEYHFAEDFHWGILIWSEGVLASVYRCGFRRRSLRIEDEAHDPALLEALVPEGTSLDALAPVLYPPRRNGDAGRAAARRFAEVMQLGNVEWLGPDTIADRLSEMAEDRGVLLLGSPPPAAPAIRVPKPIKSAAEAELPNTAMTARDAAALLLPGALEWARDALLTCVMATVREGAADERNAKGPWLDENGRTTTVGGWSLLFRSASRAQCLNLSLLVETSQLIRVDDAFNHVGSAGAIAGDWIDSDAVARVSEPLYRAWRAPDTPLLFHRGMKLMQTERGPCWLVTYACWESGTGRQDFNLAVDAVTGEVTVHA